MSHVSDFTRNRAEFSKDELLKHWGKWVAFSPDGREIVASCENLEEIDDVVRRAGFDPEAVYLEKIELDDSAVGGAQLH
jgi:hypothetical protein